MYVPVASYIEQLDHIVHMILDGNSNGFRRQFVSCNIMSKRVAKTSEELAPSVPRFLSQPGPALKIVQFVAITDARD